MQVDTTEMVEEVGTNYGNHWIQSESFGIATAAFLVVLFSAVIIILLTNMLVGLRKDIQEYNQALKKLQDASKDSYSTLELQIGKLRGAIDMMDEKVRNCIVKEFSDSSKLRTQEHERITDNVNNINKSVAEDIGDINKALEGQLKISASQSSLIELLINKFNGVK